jgi:SepF-like predicted cell division protein (DUF552 family)|nr:MAG: hypothetical protein KatS3mg041_0329 [Bacteroidota bacterium]
MQIEGRIARSQIPMTRASRISKYVEILQALKQLNADEALMIDVSDERNPRSAAQRIASTVRRYAKGEITGKIKSRFDANRKKVYLWIQS